MTEDKVATLTSDIKRNYVNDEDISRAYILHEKDLYSLVILALKGVRSKSLSETNKTTNDKEVSQEKSVKSTQTKPSPEDETLPPETLLVGEFPGYVCTFLAVSVVLWPPSGSGSLFVEGML